MKIYVALGKRRDTTPQKRIFHSIPVKDGTEAFKLLDEMPSWSEREFLSHVKIYFTYRNPLGITGQPGSVYLINSEGREVSANDITLIGVIRNDYIAKMEIEEQADWKEYQRKKLIKKHASMKAYQLMTLQQLRRVYRYSSGAEKATITHLIFQYLNS